MIAIERGIEIVSVLASSLAKPDRMPAEEVPLTASLHRILREDALSDADSPRFDKAIRDGFAVRFEDVAQIPADLQIVSESRAGAGTDVEVRQGQCCEIMTGAPLPPGANAVV